MCGILGLVRLSDKLDVDATRFRRALATLRHRGPDSESIRRFGDDAMLGHTRLSIIDLTKKSNQPFSILDRYWIVYNGEIYNYLEIRKELEQLGVQFCTDGDTEVLLHAYAVWGSACVDRFNGMWAFAIYDIQDKILFCSRDRFGVKPFNYSLVNGQFLFASEIKALIAYRPELAVPDYNAISNYCQTSVGAQNNQTWFKEVQRLPAGHNLIICNRQVRIERYWHYPSKINRRIKFDEAKEQYTGLFKDAVRLRMRSDVPLGIMLSSGVDSSSIAYAMHEIDPSSHHCFTARYRSENQFETEADIYKQRSVVDESVSARLIAQELDYVSHSIDTDYKDLVQDLSRVIFYLESGHSSPAIIPLMQLLGEAKKFVTVIMDGQGADELLGGYIASTIMPAAVDLAARGHIREAVHSLRRFMRTYHLSYAAKIALRALSNDIDAISRIHQRVLIGGPLLGPELRDYSRCKDYMQMSGEGASDMLGKTLLRQHSGGLINLLHYGDAISMANGMEARMPFMDYRLVEFVFSLPSEFKVKEAVGKHLHRSAMRELVPDAILDQSVKLGFNTPIGQILQERPEIISILTERRCVERGLFDPRGIEKLIHNHRSGRHDHGPILFRLLSTELWFRCFIDSPPDVPAAGQQCPAPDSTTDVMVRTNSA